MFCGGLVGSGIGFYVQYYPAQVFMVMLMLSLERLLGLVLLIIRHDTFCGYGWLVCNDFISSTSDII